MEDYFNFAPGNLGRWFLVYNIVSTQLYEIWKTTSFFWKWKTTSFFLKMDDDLNLFENERRPQLFWKTKTTSIFDNGKRPQILKIEDDLIFLKMEDNLFLYAIAYHSARRTVSQSVTQSDTCWIWIQEILIFYIINIYQTY